MKTTAKKGITGKTIAFTVIGGVLTVGVAYVIYQLLNKKPTTFGEGLTDVIDTVKETPSIVTSTIGKYTDKGFPLKVGSGGDNVISLQKFLNAQSGYGLVVDGKFGALTQKAVIGEQGVDESSWTNFKSMYPDAVKGQVTKSYFDNFIKGKY